MYFFSVDLRQGISKESFGGKYLSSPQSQGFRSRKERASGPEAAEAAPQDPDKNWSQDLKAAMIGWLDGPTRAWEKLRSDVASGAVANRVRVMLNSLDAQLGVGTKLNKVRRGSPELAVTRLGEQLRPRE